MKRLFSILTAAALLVFTACGSPPSAETPESAEGQQIRLTVGDIQIDITLNGSQAAAALVQMLPLELTLIERKTVRNSYPIFLGQRRWNCCRTAAQEPMD